MGLFTSYCKDCNNKLDWFLKPKYGFIQCRNCDEYNSYDDLCDSQNKEDYWKIKHRKKKINKILNENGINN